MNGLFATISTSKGEIKIELEFEKTPYYYVKNNIDINFKSSLTYLVDFEYIDDNINIINSINETRIDFTNMSNKLLLNYNYNYIFKPSFNKENTIIDTSKKNILETAIQYLLLHVYESNDINNENILNLKGVSRLFDYNKELYDKFNDNTIYCIYTKYNKTQILNNILKNTSEEIINIYTDIY